MSYLRRRAEEPQRGADFQLAKTADFEMAIDINGSSPFGWTQAYRGRTNLQNLTGKTSFSPDERAQLLTLISRPTKTQRRKRPDGPPSAASDCLAVFTSGLPFSSRGRQPPPVRTTGSRYGIHVLITLRQ